MKWFLLNRNHSQNFQDMRQEHNEPSIKIEIKIDKKND